MNDPTIRLETRPEVTAFVEKVRDRLADLTDEEREELVGGLDADINELVEDGGSVAELGDPRAYADELRAAAGIERPTGRTAGRGVLRARRGGRPAGERLTATLDRARSEWFELVEHRRLRGAWDFFTVLRPAWWLLRAWVAVQLLDLATQGGDLATPVPTLGGPLLGSLVWLVAVVLSVQLGRNKLWPGSGPTRRVGARVLLLALNAFAVATTPIVLGQFPANGTWEYHDSVGHSEPPRGLTLRGDHVENVFPYDALGNPLEGVQLFDQDGKPLAVARFAGDTWVAGGRRVTYPWFNGEKRLYNVFPLPRRDQMSGFGGVRPDAWTSANPPYLPTPPLAVVPPVSLGLQADDGRADEDLTLEDPADARAAGDREAGDRDVGSR